MRPHWLVRASLRLVPASWRGAVLADLEAEARAQRHGALWSSWQAVRLAVPLRWAITGDAIGSDLRQAVRSLRSAPFFALTGANGEASLTGLAPGRYRVHVWTPRLKRADLPASVEIDVAADRPAPFAAQFTVKLSPAHHSAASSLQWSRY